MLQPLSFTKSLYWRISLILLSLLNVLAVVLFVVFALSWNRVSDETAQILSGGLAREIAPRFEEILKGSPDIISQRLFIRDLTLANPKTQFYLLSEDGTVLADFVDIAAPTKRAVRLEPIRQFLARGAGQKQAIYGDDPRSRNSQTVFSAAPVSINGKSGYLYIVLQSDRQIRLGSILLENSALQGILVSFACTILGVGLLGMLIFSFVTKRFQRLTAVVSKYEAGDFSERVAITSDDEVDALGRAVNQMADTIVANISELKRRDQLRRELIADISHDLRGPVAVISGNAERAIDKLDQAEPEKVKEYCATILKSGGLLQRLLAELFELAKLEAREIRVTFSPFRVVQLLEDLVLTYRTEGQRRGLEIRDVITDEELIACGDTGLVARALSNLIENAMRYTPSGGSIEIRARAEGKRVYLEVADTGVGIEESDLPNVFERFFRAEKQSAPSGSSAGLGLAIVKKIIDAHQSEISVSSKKGEGTVFSFYLPAP